MNLSALGSILGVATQLLGASPLGSQTLGGGQAQPASSNGPLSAILSLTKQADGLATSGLSGALGSIAGLLA